MKATTDYWFTIEPYVYVSIVNKSSILYNTLDGVIIESDKPEVIILLQEILKKENCGVTLLKSERYRQKEINDFVRELRGKYMGDIIDLTLSKGKPIQVLPYVDFFNRYGKKYDFLKVENILQTLSQINIHIDCTSDIAKLITFLQSMPDGLTFNIIGDLRGIKNNYDLFSFFNQCSSPKTILCSYTNIATFDSTFNNDFSYKVSVCFPVNMQQWSEAQKILLHQNLPFEYVFDVTSLVDCQEAEYLIKQYQIEKYHLYPIYTGDNIGFFEENVFLTKDDILSTSMSIRDFFIKQSMNIHDFGKINIMPNGDVFANINQPILGNIYTHSIHEMVRNEIKNGKSWLRIRNQAPCNGCIYQWFCPSPSDYEMTIGRPDLCCVNK